MQEDDDPDTMHNNLAMIVSCGRRLSYLVNDILDLSALKVGSLSILFFFFILFLEIVCRLSLSQNIHSHTPHQYYRPSQSSTGVIISPYWKQGP